MSERMGFSLPILGVEYSYEYRDTGESWIDGGVMSEGVHKRTIGFTSPLCDEIRFTASSNSSFTLDRFHLAGLSISEGLTFDSSSGLSDEPQPVIYRPSQTNHFTFKLSESSATSHSFTIKGINQRKIDIRQLFFAKLEWQPVLNYANESPELTGFEYLDQKTRHSNYQKKISGGRVLDLQFNNQTEDHALDIVHIEKNKTEDGFLLFERDSESITLRQDYFFAANIRVTDLTPISINKFRITVNIKEAFEQ